MKLQCLLEMDGFPHSGVVPDQRWPWATPQQDEHLVALLHHSEGLGALPHDVNRLRRKAGVDPFLREFLTAGLLVNFFKRAQKTNKIWSNIIGADISWFKMPFRCLLWLFVHHGSVMFFLVCLLSTCLLSNQVIFHIDVFHDFTWGFGYVMWSNLISV